MVKGVLTVVDLQAPAAWAATYGMQLAARLKSPLAFMVVAPPSGDEETAEAAPISLAELPEAQRSWLAAVVRQCREAGVNVDLYFSRGSVVEEVTHFMAAAAAIQFIVIGVPRHSSRGLDQARLSRLHREFSGEILLVREKGEITRLANSEREP